MKLKKLSLANCGGFEQLDIEFEPDVTLIAGVNGVGKSTILRALARVLSRAMPEFTPARSVPIYFTDDDIHGDKNSLEVSAKIQLNDQILNAGLQRRRNTEEKAERFVLLRQIESTEGTTQFNEVLRSRTLTGDLEAGMQETRATLQTLKKAINPPLAVYFTPKRQLIGKPKTLPDSRIFDTPHAYERALTDREVDLREFMHWFRALEELTLFDNEHKHRILKALRAVVTELIPEFNNLRVKVTSNPKLIVDKNGHTLDINQLSDGERGLLALVLDLTRRLAIANPESRNPISDGEGLVLIDEIELHLHPKWQRRIVRKLTELFKNCQFVITTHSPQVIGQVEAKSLRLLSYNDSGKTILTPTSQAFGMDSNWILMNVMGVPARDYETEQRLKQIYDAIDKGNFQESRKLSTELRSDIGDFPDLQEITGLLDRFDLLKQV